MDAAIVALVAIPVASRLHRGVGGALVKGVEFNRLKRAITRPTSLQEFAC